jgi:hypothetical protein
MRKDRRAILLSILAAKAESDAALISLGAELAACDALKSNCPEKDDEQYAVLDLQHWDLREKINRIPAATLEGIRVKARAAEFAIKEDIDVTCEGEGSFVDLCRSINPGHLFDGRRLIRTGGGN